MVFKVVNNVINVRSIKENIEFGAGTYSIALPDGADNVGGTDTDGNVYVLSLTVKGTKRLDSNGARLWEIDPKKVINKDYRTVGPNVGFLGTKGATFPMPGTFKAMVHTHAQGHDRFSGGDIQFSKNYKVPIYMSNKLGRLSVYDYYKTGRNQERRVGFVPKLNNY